MRTFRFSFSVHYQRDLVSHPVTLALCVDVLGVNETDAVTRFFTHSPIRYVLHTHEVLFINPSAVSAVKCEERLPEDDTSEDDTSEDDDPSQVVIKFPTKGKP